MGYHKTILFYNLSITFLFQSLLYLPIVLANDTLLLGDELDSSSILLSLGGKFTLGFFTITTPPSYNLTYLGIWYTNNQPDLKVWIANRDKPIVGRNGTLKLDNSGTLRLINQHGATLFNISNVKISAGNTRAILEDSGNFILYDGANRTIWQSFDYPTDTLIPGMKIGYNLTTGQNWTLTSSTDDGFVASGIFTLRLEIYKSSPQLLIHRRGHLYWASAPWNESSGDFVHTNFWNHYKMNMITDASGMYFTLQTSVSSTLRLSPAGYFVDNYLETEPPYFCYGYQTDDYGCAVSNGTMGVPYCRGTDDYYWVQWDSESVFLSGVMLSDYKTEDDTSISIGDCMERCWNDCNCQACSTYNNGTGCKYSTYNRHGDYLLGGNVSPFFLRYSPKYEKTWTRELFSLLLVPIVVLAYVSIKRRIFKGKENRKRDNFIQQMTGSNSFNYGDELERGIEDAPNVKIFSLKAITSATNNFSDENKLGQGGYGPVYKGVLSDGREIAVKRLSKSSGQGILEFKSELILISKLQHTNLVRLYGCCVHQEEKMLIYEFMPNKSLDFFLFAQDEKEKIGWQVRFNIIEGIAQGLIYLHKYSRMKVIHRDLKVGNILLDENMNPKIADFGMARIFHQNVVEAVTQRVAGTYGYMAPEYAMEGTFSIKSDVFSFGVLILEIVSGRKNSSFYNPDQPLNLVTYAWDLWKGHASLELKDETLEESYDTEQLLRVIHVGLLCVQDNADDRPTMSDVIYVLNNENTDLPSPKKPAFFTRRQTTGFHLEIPISLSKISLTVTTMEAR